jgi:hypothetical protein
MLQYGVKMQTYRVVSVADNSGGLYPTRIKERPEWAVVHHGCDGGSGSEQIHF